MLVSLTSVQRMRSFRWSGAVIAAIVVAAALAPRAALGQQPTATQPAQLSAFAGMTGDYTGLDGGKNLGFTAGVDLALPPVRRWIRPTVEVRGTYPVNGGHIDSQREILFGPRVDVWLGHRLHPYGDFLFGRGQMNYNKGFFFENQDYLLTTTWVESYGGGVDYDLTSSLAVKVDAQYQHWGAAPVPGGSIYAKAGTLGIVYVFNFNRHGIR